MTNLVNRLGHVGKGFFGPTNADLKESERFLKSYNPRSDDHIYTCVNVEGDDFVVIRQVEGEDLVFYLDAIARGLSPNIDIFNDSIFSSLMKTDKKIPLGLGYGTKLPKKDFEGRLNLH